MCIRDRQCASQDQQSQSFTSCVTLGIAAVEMSTLLVEHLRYQSLLEMQPVRWCLMPEPGLSASSF
eukprot:1656784-Amphidinium_carterae.1